MNEEAEPERGPSLPRRLTAVGGALLGREVTRAKREASQDLSRLVVAAGMGLVGFSFLIAALLVLEAALAVWLRGRFSLTVEATLLVVAAGNAAAAALLGGFAARAFRRPVLHETRASVRKLVAIFRGELGPDEESPN